MVKVVFWTIFLVAVCGCGYRYQEESSRVISVNVPYVEGDISGLLNQEICSRLNTSGKFCSAIHGGEFTLKARILNEERDRIGFRYDRDNPSGDIEKNILGVEARRTISLEIALVKGADVVFGPTVVKASVDYDYTDPGSPRDLLFSQVDPVIQFSLGQLDSAEGAYDDAMRPLAAKLAEKLVEGLVHKWIFFCEI